MKVPLSWLKEYVAITVPVEDLARRLTLAGLEVAGIERRGGDWDNIQVGEVVTVEPHPNADRLRLATVDLGTERYTVVCGAPNVAPGQKIAFARLGARLRDGHTGQVFTLKAARIRGVVSEGMVCSEKELGLSEEHEGILVLPQESPVARPLAEVLGDAVLDIEVTPNRPDCLSVLGISREVAALTGQPVREPEVLHEQKGEPAEKLTSVAIQDPDLCPRYTAGLVLGIRAGPSPAWMQERLAAAGLRPISNVVDVTNYVMLEMGQPLHAFDFDKLRSKRIVVRRARAGETLITLDGAERSLGPENLVIADAEGAVAIGGVVGGANSEVDDSTTAVLLEAAAFSPVSIRRTAVGLKLRTEASLRFEKGLNPVLAMLAQGRALKLIREVAGGEVAKGVIDVFPGQSEPRPIVLTADRLQRVLGMEVSSQEAQRVLASLGFRCQETGQGMEVFAPYWRSDISCPEDLVEEVGRILGYDRIPTTLPSGALPAYEPGRLLETKEALRRDLVALGMQEVITYSLVHQSQDRELRPPDAPDPLRVLNPMSPEQEYLRTTLRVGLLKALAANERREESVRLFEAGRVYWPVPGDLPQEREMVSGVLSGSREAKSWFGGQSSLDFYDAKGVVEAALTSLRIEARFEPGRDVFFLPGRCASVFCGDREIGVLGEVGASPLAVFDISVRPVAYFELNVEALATLRGQPAYAPVSRFPALVRDLAVVVASDVPAQRVAGLIGTFPSVHRVTLFDVYSGEHIPPGQKSLAFRIVFQAVDRTLTEAEVARAHEQLLRRLEQEVGARLRE